MNSQRPEDMLNAAIDRLAAGESVGDVLLAHPGEAAEMLGLLRPAAALLAAPAPPSATPHARAAAMQQMFGMLAETRTPTAGFAAWTAAFRSWPGAFQAAALAGVVAVFTVAGVGAAAAAGSGPVRDVLGISSESSIRVELDGVITAIDVSTITVDAGGDIREVIVTDDTELEGVDGLGALSVGDMVEIKGKLQTDNTIVASSIRLAGAAVPTPTIVPAAPPPTVAPPVVPPPHDDDEFDDDSSGPGGGDDDDDVDDDNSGPGGGDDDDEFDDDNSGPGGGDDDDEFDDDNSGPGDGDDDEFDDDRRDDD